MLHSETISRASEARYVHKKIFADSGGEFSLVRLRLQPSPTTVLVEFRLEHSLPTELILGIEEGVEEALWSGVLGGGPVVGVQVLILDATCHEIDSNRRTFRIAAREAVWQAMREAGPVLVY